MCCIFLVVFKRLVPVGLQLCGSHVGSCFDEFLACRVWHVLSVCAYKQTHIQSLKMRLVLAVETNICCGDNPDCCGDK